MSHWMQNCRMTMRTVCGLCLLIIRANVLFPQRSTLRYFHSSTVTLLLTWRYCSRRTIRIVSGYALVGGSYHPYFHENWANQIRVIFCHRCYGDRSCNRREREREKDDVTESFRKNFHALRARIRGSMASIIIA